MSAAPPETPQWRQTYDALERELAPRLDELVRSEQFATTLRIGAKLQRSVRRQADHTSRQVLHALGLPARADVVRVLREIGATQRQLADLERQVAVLRRDPAHPGR